MSKKQNGRDRDPFIKQPYYLNDDEYEELVNIAKTRQEGKTLTVGKYQLEKYQKDGRPPKDWWERCTSSVAAKGTAVDPAAVCGAMWKRIEKSENPIADKKKILKESYNE